ncbi:hypothetical protein [Tolypothrix bouteillei]
MGLSITLNKPYQYFAFNTDKAAELLQIQSWNRTQTDYPQSNSVDLFGISYKPR